MKYITDYRNKLDNGLVLLEADWAFNPDNNWLYYKHPDGQWVTKRELKGLDLLMAQQQAEDCQVLSGHRQ